MRRFFTAFINWILCVCMAILLRFLIAIPHRWLVILAASQILYDRWDIFPWRILFLMPLFVSCFYYLYVGRFRQGITLGERITGIRINVNLKIWHAILEGWAIILYPLTIIFICFTGRMPYDRILKVEVQDIRKKSAKRMKRRYRVLLLLLTSLLIRYGYSRLNMFQQLSADYCATGTIAWMINANLVAGAYTRCIEPKYYYLGETELTEAEMEEWEKEIFSEEREKEACGFVVKEEKKYMEQYKKYGINFEAIDYENNELIVAYGRKLGKIRILYDRYINWRETSSGWPTLELRLELKDDYKKGMVYFYTVPEKDLYRLTNDYSVWEDDEEFSYVCVDWFVDDYDSRINTIERGGIFRRWIWACWIYRDILSFRLY